VRLILRDVAAQSAADTACGTAALLCGHALCRSLRASGKVAAERLWPTLQDRVCQGGIFLLDGPG
jgi:hypothetical protein